MDELRKMQEILQSVSAGELSYSEWLKMVMAAKSCGMSADEVESWAAQGDSRHRNSDVRKRWAALNNTVGIGTAVYIAKQHGFSVPREWCCTGVAVRPEPIRGNASDEYIAKIKRWASALPEVAADVGESDFEQLIDGSLYSRADMATEFVSAMFDDADVVGLCRCIDVEPPEQPQFRFCRAGEFKQWIEQGHDDFDLTLLDNEPDECIRASLRAEHVYLPQHILLNPVKPNSDNKYSAKVESIASYRHILVESDEASLYEQYKTLTALQLPISALVYSGNKSLHAFVRVDAKTLGEYRERFEFVRDVCAAYGLQIDEACKNPNRWARMAAARRSSTQLQTLVATNIGCTSFEEWRKDIDNQIKRTEYLASLKRFGISETTLAALNAEPPAEVPCIIEGALKRGREGILIASSKAGKSWLCLELAVAVAEGKRWLDYSCNAGKVGVVNMELGADDVYERMQLIAPRGMQHPENIHFLNCAGVCSDLATLQDTIEAFAMFNELDLLIIDPVYSLFGQLQENVNGDVMQFLERLAQIRRNTGCATFMTHHMSKGSQDGKASIDMGSGAGAFARHPDFILTMQTATEENIKGIDREVLRAELDSGIGYFVLTETLRSFKSTRKSEMWRADFPEYKRATGIDYDKMGAAHAAQAAASENKYSKAVQLCIEKGIELTQANIAAAAGVSKQAASRYKQDNPELWENLLSGATL